MNRIIKFRAWSEIYKEMSTTFGSDENINDFFAKTNLTIMQFTGLTDKNGKEIFEADIIRDSLGNIATVEWEQEGRFLGFTVGKRVIIYINREPQVEIIGNIYQHSHLLQANPKSL